MDPGQDSCYGPQGDDCSRPQGMTAVHASRHQAERGPHHDLQALRCAEGQAAVQLGLRKLHWVAVIHAIHLHW
jgi:hypothetical protein